MTLPKGDRMLCFHIFPSLLFMFPVRVAQFRKCCSTRFLSDPVLWKPVKEPSAGVILSGLELQLQPSQMGNPGQVT